MKQHTEISISVIKPAWEVQLMSISQLKKCASIYLLFGKSYWIVCNIICNIKKYWTVILSSLQIFIDLTSLCIFFQAQFHHCPKQKCSKCVGCVFSYYMKRTTNTSTFFFFNKFFGMIRTWTFPIPVRSVW